MTPVPILEEPRRIVLREGPVAYTLRRSRRARRLRVTIDPLRGVIVTIPMRGAVRAVEAFLRDREAWLWRHLRTQAARRVRAAAGRAFGPDGRIAFRGELHRVRV
jgi:predicted metal-dependent hydrolase